MPIIPLALALAQFAPELMRFFGAGEATAKVAEKVVDVAASVTGSREPTEILAKLRGNPELAHAFSLAVLNAETELQQAFLADRADARRRDVEMRKLTGGSNRRADVMVLLDVIGLIACLVVLALFRKDMPAEAAGLLTTVATAFALCLRDAHQFEFGSSRGSRDKDELLTRQQTGG